MTETTTTSEITSTTEPPFDPSVPFTHDDPEVVRAVDLGLVSARYLSQPTKAATVNDVIELFGNVLIERDTSKLSEWEKLVNRSEQDAITADSILAAYYIASILTEGGVPYTNGANCYGFGDEQTIWNGGIQWIGAEPKIIPYSQTCPGFYNLDEQDSLVTNDNYTISMGYAIATYSYYSNQCLVPIDFVNQTYHVADTLTREKLALMVVRFYDSFTPTPRYVVLEDVASGSTITAEDIANAAAVPAVDEHGMSSEWVGTYSQIKSGLRPTGWCPSNDHVMSNFYESDFRFMSEHNINYIRIQFALPSLGWPDMPADRSLVNMHVVEELDQVIRWGLEYGIHVSICFQSYPDDDTDGLGAMYEDGTLENHFTPDYLASDESWELKTRLLTAFAKRYADIPREYLSFELQNETASYVPEGYDSMALADRFIALANAIWAVDDDRALSVSTSETLLFDKAIDFWKRIGAAGINFDYHCYQPAFCFTDPYGDIREEELVWPYVDRNGVTWDMEAVYQEHIAPWVALAEECDVGFKLGECGIFGGSMLVYQEKHVVAWAEDFKQTMRKHGVMYVVGTLSGNIRSSVLCDFYPTWGEGQRYREGAVHEMITYEFEEYHTTFFYDPALTKALYE